MSDLQHPECGLDLQIARMGPEAHESAADPVSFLFFEQVFAREEPGSLGRAECQQVGQGLFEPPVISRGAEMGEQFRSLDKPCIAAGQARSPAEDTVMRPVIVVIAHVAVAGVKMLITRRQDVADDLIQLGLSVWPGIGRELRQSVEVVNVRKLQFTSGRELRLENGMPTAIGLGQVGARIIQQIDVIRARGPSRRRGRRAGEGATCGPRAHERSRRRRGRR